MKLAVRYYSRGGNTKKLALAVAGALNVMAHTTGEKITEPIDILFLGSALYAWQPDKNISEFIKTLSPEIIKNVVIFTTSASPNSPYPKIKKLLEEQGLNVSEKFYHCPGEFLFANKNRPTEDDLKKIAEFAKDIVKTME